MEIDFDKYILSAIEVDEINSTCPDLTDEEQAIHDKYCED